MGNKRKAVAQPKKVEVEVEEQKPKIVKQEASEEEEEQEEEEESSEEEEEEEEEEGGGGGEEEESEELEEDDSSSESESEEDEDSKRESVRKLLEPFGKDQIIEFLKEAALKEPSILERINQLADKDPTHRKIFVYGLGWDATTEQVMSVLKHYGDIEECRVVTDKVTGRAKGYAFVLFKTRASAKKALKQKEKKIGNRMTTCQLASSGPGPGGPDSTGHRKIYVGSVGPHINPDHLRSFFAKFGEIEEGPLGQDPITRKLLKGFAIFVYKTAEGCKKALEEPTKLFEDCQLQCRRAVEGHRNNNNNNNNNNQTPTPTPSSSSSSIIQQRQSQADINTLNYGMAGQNPGILSHNNNVVNPAAVLVGQNPGMGIGLTNPGMLASAFNQTGFLPTGYGLSPAIGGNPSFAFSGNYGINSITPSIIGSYGPQAALQGLGAYQSSQLGHSSATGGATRPQTGLGSTGTTFPSYFGR